VAALSPAHFEEAAREMKPLRAGNR
jgi:hypothetical protein